MSADNRYLLLNEENKVVNAIVYDGSSSYSIPDGYTLVKAVEGVFYDIGLYKAEDGLFYYKHSDGTLHLNQENMEEM